MKEKVKLIVMQGIPASGKSTWAKKYAYNNYKTVIVSRDSLRSMCGKYWLLQREKLITQFEENLVEIALKDGYNVIVDATNMTDSAIEYWRSLINDDELLMENVELVVQRLDISLWKAVYRDFKRGLFGGRMVGYKVIKRFYNKR